MISLHLQVEDLVEVATCLSSALRLQTLYLAVVSHQRLDQEHLGLQALVNLVLHRLSHQVEEPRHCRNSGLLQILAQAAESRLKLDPEHTGLQAEATLALHQAPRLVEDFPSLDLSLECRQWHRMQILPSSALVILQILLSLALVIQTRQNLVLKEL